MARRILTEREKDRFIELYPNTPNKQLEMIFSMNTTSVYQTAARLGVKKSDEYFQLVNHANNGRAWTKKEIDILKDNYIYYSDAEMMNLIPNRPAKSISSKRMQLGLYKNNPEKLEQLRKQRESKQFIKSNQILLHNTRQSIDKVLKLYNVTEKIADKI